MQQGPVLTATQAKFLKALFTTARGDMKKAASSVTGSEDYHDLLTDELLDAIKIRADQELVLNSAKAVYVLSEIISNPGSVIDADRIARVCSDILDRAGLSKRERQGNNQTIVGVVFLPNKQPLPEPPAIEEGTFVEVPQLKSIEPQHDIRPEKT
jgi:hypothetical protein